MKTTTFFRSIIAMLLVVFMLVSVVACADPAMHRGIACLNRKFIFVSKNALFTGRFLNNPARIAYIEYMKKSIK